MTDDSRPPLHSRPPDSGPPDSRSGRHVGRGTLRTEDARFVTGSARWTDAIAAGSETVAGGGPSAGGALRLGVVRSPLAHGRIARVDLEAARAHPAVVLALSGRDLHDVWRACLPVRAPAGAHVADQPPVAVDTVRYVGEPVAAVVVDDPYAVDDAMELVDVRYEPLPAVPFTPSPDGDGPDGVRLHAEAERNVAYRYDGLEVGNVDAALADADVVMRRRYAQPRVVAASMEPRAVLAEPTPAGNLVVHISTQVPHRIRDMVALVLGLDAERVRVVAPDVGGGFGAKLDCYPEDLLCAAIALRLRRPVRWTATRTEDFQGTHHGRGQVRDVAIGARLDGTLVALDVHVTGDCGAYISRAGANVHLNSEKLSPGCYRWQGYRFRATGRFSTAVPTAPYRGAGRPEAVFGAERAMDDLAALLGMDPAELRRRNFPSPDAFPFPSVGGLTFDSGDYAAALERALEAVDYAGWREAQAQRREAGATRRIGIGLACWIDRCGSGPGLGEHGAVEIDGSGLVTVRTGLGPSGQGTATSLAQIVADTFGLDPARIRVVHGDTAEVPDGRGTFGSRSMAVGAIAVRDAAQEVARLAREVAAELLEAAEADLDVDDGRVAVRGTPGAAVSLAQVAAAARGGVVPGIAGLAAASAYEPDGLTFPFGTVVVVVDVDTETGAVAVLRVVGVNDCGNVVNPTLVDGQLHGGLAQGLAQALYEEAVHDEDGNLLTASFVDYLMPGAPDVPTFELLRTVTPSGNALGVKGVGEAGAIAAPPAVVNAVVDALRDLGVDDVAMPCTPERVWRAIAEAASRD